MDAARQQIAASLSFDFTELLLCAVAFVLLPGYITIHGISFFRPWFSRIIPLFSGMGRPTPQFRSQQSESALSWTQPHNRDRSTAISATLIAPQLMCWKNGVLSKFVFGAE
jgi:hypothetical protein